jgi:hypothetical protein
MGLQTKITLPIKCSLQSPAGVVFIFLSVAGFLCFPSSGKKSEAVSAAGGYCRAILRSSVAGFL